MHRVRRRVPATDTGCPPVVGPVRRMAAWSLLLGGTLWLVGLAVSTDPASARIQDDAHDDARAPAQHQAQATRATSGDDRLVVSTSVEGVITPVTRDHLDTVITQAEQVGAEAVVIRLDTPGGLLDATRSIVQRFLAAEVAVVVHVAPAGADAGSAGTFITTAAHVAAMAPSTTIGAATPVDLEGGVVDDKIVENTVAFAQAIAEARDRDVDFLVDSVRDGRSITARTALDEGVVDLIATDLDDLLAALDGRTVTIDGAERTLRTDAAQVVDEEPSTARRLLQILADPNLAFVFLSLGTLAILYEIANPGLGLGGVVGVVALVLAMFSISVLPVQTAGLVLVGVAVVMFIAELFIPGIGVGAAGGTGALVLAGLFLFQDGSGVDVDWWVLVPTAAVTFGASAFAGVMAARSRKVEPVRGSDDLIGREGLVQDAASGRPRIVVYGSYWRVKPDGEHTLHDGDVVRVVARDNLDLIVAPAERPSPESPSPRTT